MNPQCRKRRIEEIDAMAKEVTAGESQRNHSETKPHWTFTVKSARRNMKKTPPSIQDA